MWRSFAAPWMRTTRADCSNCWRWARKRADKWRAAVDTPARLMESLRRHLAEQQRVDALGLVTAFLLDAQATLLRRFRSGTDMAHGVGLLRLVLLILTPQG